MNFLQAAFNLTQFGWKVFPLRAGEKIPACKHGVKEATDDENVIAAWSHRHPEANIGVACGKISGIIAIDLDPRNGSDASIARFASRKQDFTPTVSVRTANGGYHLYYAWESGLKNSKSVLAPGIDVKTDGGYLVAPPSVLHGGKAYAWTNSPLGGDLPRLPRWAFEALKPRPKPVLVPNASTLPGDAAALVKFVAEAQEGDRNKKLFWAAAKAAAEGTLAAERSAFTHAALSIGLDRDEVRRTIDSAEQRCSKLA